MFRLSWKKVIIMYSGMVVFLGIIFKGMFFVIVLFLKNIFDFII